MRIPVSKPSITSIEKQLVAEALDKVQLSQGERVRRFELMLADYLKTRYVVATTSGTTALHLALASLGIGPGDEVLVPDLTFVATANAVKYTGATPVLVDVNPESWCINPYDAAAKVTSRTRAIIPVHLYGVACDMTALSFLASRHRLSLVEDAAEGFTGEYLEDKLGTMGIVGTYSFYGNKVVTCGEGGAVSTDSEFVASRLRFLRGQALDPNRRYFHPEVGFNYRMTDIQASIGIGQMYRLAEMLQRRREIFSIYESRLCYDAGITPVAPRDTRTAPWVFTLQLNPHVTRDGLMSRLAERGIETRPGFVPLHRMPMYSRPDREFPDASRIGDQSISLPTFPDMKDEDAHEVCDAVLAEVR